MRKSLWAAAAVLGLPYIAVDHVGAVEASPVRGQQAGPVITITDFSYSPEQTAAAAGQPITITNNDDFPHTVTARDGTFNVEVPEKGTVTVSVPKAGSFPYTCTYHPGQHNPASINVS